MVRKMPESLLNALLIVPSGPRIPWMGPLKMGSWNPRRWENMSDMFQDTARSKAVFVLITDSSVSGVVRTAKRPYMQRQLAVIDQSCAPRDSDISASM